MATVQCLGADLKAVIQLWTQISVHNNFSLFFFPFTTLQLLQNSVAHVQGVPPLTQKSLTRFLAYVRVSGGISVSRGAQSSPTNTKFM